MMRLILYAMFISAALLAHTEQNFIEMVPMRDGVKLRTRIILPDGDGPWPVILTRTYVNDNDLNWNLARQYCSDKCASVVQYMRGLNGSEGKLGYYHTDGWGELQDGYDTVQWIKEQSWSNEQVSSMGGSGRGGFANMLAGAAPPNHVCQVLSVAASDMYRGFLYEGGAWCYQQSVGWYGSLYPEAIETVLAHHTYDDFWKSQDITTRQHLRNYPVWISTGWYDVFLKTSINNFNTLRQNGGPVAKEHSKLVISLFAHQGRDVPTGLPFPLSAKQVPPEHDWSQFLDRYLFGIANGFDSLPRVAYYMFGDLLDSQAPGNEWRYADQWPPSAQGVNLYLHPGGALRLNLAPADAPPIQYQYDPRNPVPTIGGQVHTIPAGAFDQSSLDGRADIVVFETDTLTTPLEIAGHLQARIWASSSAVDTDFTAKLMDVYPDGKSYIITDGIIRASSRLSLSSRTPLVPGKLYPFTIDLWHTALVFNAGHKIRLAVSSSNFPRFEANPNTGALPALSHSETFVATNVIVSDANKASYLTLPVVGPDTDGDTVADLIDPDPNDASDNGGLRFMSLDTNQDKRVSLSELVRVIELYNFGEFQCDASTEDGYSIGNTAQTCAFHTSDYRPADWSIQLFELLRVIQIYNLGGYISCPMVESEDGFCPVSEL